MSVFNMSIFNAGKRKNKVRKTKVKTEPLIPKSERRYSYYDPIGDFVIGVIYIIGGIAIFLLNASASSPFLAIGLLIVAVVWFALALWKIKWQAEFNGWYKGFNDSNDIHKKYDYLGREY
jgi:hypothetical protein